MLTAMLQALGISCRRNPNHNWFKCKCADQLAETLKFFQKKKLAYCHQQTRNQGRQFFSTNQEIICSWPTHKETYVLGKLLEHQLHWDTDYWFSENYSNLVDSRDVPKTFFSYWLLENFLPYHLNHSGSSCLSAIGFPAVSEQKPMS